MLRQNTSWCRQKLGDRIQEELGVTRVAELRSVTLYAAAKPFGPAVASFLTSLPHGGPDEPVRYGSSTMVFIVIFYFQCLGAANEIMQ